MGDTCAMWYRDDEPRLVLGCLQHRRTHDNNGVHFYLLQLRNKTCVDQSHGEIISVVTTENLFVFHDEESRASFSIHCLL